MLSFLGIIVITRNQLAFMYWYNLVKLSLSFSLHYIAFAFNSFINGSVAFNTNKKQKSDSFEVKVLMLPIVPNVIDLTSDFFLQNIQLFSVLVNPCTEHCPQCKKNPYLKPYSRTTVVSKPT